MLGDLHSFAVYSGLNEPVYLMNVKCDPFLIKGYYKRGSFDQSYTLHAAITPATVP